MVAFKIWLYSANLPYKSGILVRKYVQTFEKKVLSTCKEFQFSKKVSISVIYKLSKDQQKTFTLHISLQGLLRQ